MIKNKNRALRRFIDAKVIKKQINILKQYNSYSDKLIVGKLIKHHALNCGISGCFCCSNPRRIYGYKTLKEKVSVQDFKQQMKDLE